MSNGYDKAFSDMMMPRIEASRREEASALVLESLRSGRRLGDAVADVVEQLPHAKTKRLRAWTAQLDAYHEWLGFASAGWTIKRVGHGFWARADERVKICAPTPEAFKDPPPNDAIAAAANASSVSYVGRRGDEASGTAFMIYAVVRPI